MEISRRAYQLEVSAVSNDGEVVLKLFSQIRDIFEQVSLLLQTVDEQMLKADFKSEGNTAIENISFGIANPQWWIPTVAFRFYRHKDYPERLAFVSVLLDSPPDKFYVIKEPCITAGFLDFGEIHASLKDEKGYSDYWYSRYFGYLLKDPQVKLDGKPLAFENAALENDIKGRFKGGKVFGVPLVLITNASEVKSQIVTKLISLIKNTESEVQ